MIETAKYGPWALVAGGSEGVGAEFAQLLAEAGLNLVLVARKPDPLQRTAECCRQHGGACIPESDQNFGSGPLASLR